MENKERDLSDWLDYKYQGKSIVARMYKQFWEQDFSLDNCVAYIRENKGYVRIRHIDHIDTNTTVQQRIDFGFDSVELDAIINWIPMPDGLNITPKKWCDEILMLTGFFLPPDPEYVKYLNKLMSQDTGI